MVDVKLNAGCFSIIDFTGKTTIRKAHLGSYCSDLSDADTYNRVYNRE